LGAASSLASGTVACVQDYYDEVWERLPTHLTPPDFALRREFLRQAVTSGMRALDIGCGAGEFTAELADAGAQAVGADVAEGALRRARDAHPGIEFELVPIDGRLPFADNRFELVWASEVIEHVADTARWLSELRRVLTPGGTLLITTPSHGRIRLLLSGLEPFADPLGDHLHLYTARSLRTVLSEFGFGEIAIRAAGGPPLLRRLLLASARR
jgi:ubiquinone/menaquinone biosynthesis C-methylase UbiE